ncbi:MAG: sigma-54 dependent transcriptional regulator [Pseudomonadota bacterium]
MTLRALVIDDQPAILKSMEMVFRLRGWEVYTAGTGADGLRFAATLHPSVVVLDIKLPDMSGLRVLEQLKAGFPETHVIMITAYQSMDTTIEAIKLGAFDYVHKPIDVDEMEAVIQQLEQINDARRSLDSDAAYHSVDVEGRQPRIIGRSRCMKDVFKSIALVSESRVTVLIQGESGTGKELIAGSIHQNSQWSNEPFTVMDCSTLVEPLVESELFGYEKGAFTGAEAVRKGRLELAGEGTVFLDEIGEIPILLQSKLLRFLQAREFVRIGGNRPIRSNARIIAATNRDLTELVGEKKFRQDLYYRLKVVTIDVPPLRRRKSDIPLLTSFFLKKIAADCGSPEKRLAGGALDLMLDYDWPGNVRELENFLTRAAVMTKSPVLTKEYLQASLHNSPSLPSSGYDVRSSDTDEREHIKSVLNECDWHLGNASKQLGVSRPTLRAKMKKYGLSKTARGTIV